MWDIMKMNSGLKKEIKKIGDLGRGRQGSELRVAREKTEAEKVYETAINDFFVCFLSTTCLLSSITLPLCDLTLHTTIPILHQNGFRGPSP